MRDNVPSTLILLCCEVEAHRRCQLEVSVRGRGDVELTDTDVEVHIVESERGVVKVGTRIL